MVSAVLFHSVIVVLLLIGGALESNKTVSRRRIVFYFIVLVFAWGGNKFNGSDWMNYLTAYHDVSAVDSMQVVLATAQFEWLFTLWMWVFGSNEFPYEAFVFSVAVVNTSCLLWFLTKVDVRRWGWLLATLFLILGWSIYQEQLRQSLAISFLFPFYIFVARRRFLPALLMLVLATGFHSTAIFGLTVAAVILLIQHRKGVPPTLKQLVVASLMFASVVLVYHGAGRFGVFSMIGLRGLQAKYNYYLTDDVYGQSLLNLGMLAYLIGFCILWAARRRRKDNMPFWYSVAWTAAMLWCLIGPWLRTTAILIRLEWYLLAFLPFAVAAYGSDPIYPRMVVETRRAMGVMGGWLLAATFMGRVLISPEYEPWVDNYQNIFLGIFSDSHDLRYGEEDFRREEICSNLKLYNNFCE